jgi:nitrilase
MARIVARRPERYLPRMRPAVVAAVQATPVFLDREATVDKIGTLVAKAAAEGAELVAFPEGFVPTYPDWVWRTKPWDEDFSAYYALLLDQAVEVPSPTTDALGVIAVSNKTYLAVCVNERDPDGGTVYNTLLYIGPDGELLAKHRKLVVTGGERLVWGVGHVPPPVLDTPFGRLGGLLCWENYMPLVRASLWAQGVDVYLAPTWDNSDEWVASMRHIAKEGRCFVLGLTSCIRATDVPATVPNHDELYGDPDDWLSKGNTCIVGPTGRVLAGPVPCEEVILYAEVDPAAARATRYQFDATGHYSRPDIFQLTVRGADAGGDLPVVHEPAP